MVSRERAAAFAAWPRKDERRGLSPAARWFCAARRLVGLCGCHEANAEHAMLVVMQRQASGDTTGRLTACLRNRLLQRTCTR